MNDTYMKGGRIRNETILYDKKYQKGLLFKGMGGFMLDLPLEGNTSAYWPLKHLIRDQSTEFSRISPNLSSSVNRNRLQYDMA